MFSCYLKNSLKSDTDPGLDPQHIPDPAIRCGSLLIRIANAGTIHKDTGVTNDRNGGGRPRRNACLRSRYWSLLSAPGGKVWTPVAGLTNTGATRLERASRRTEQPRDMIWSAIHAAFLDELI